MQVEDQAWEEVEEAAEERSVVVVGGEGGTLPAGSRAAQGLAADVEKGGSCCGECAPAIVPSRVSEKEGHKRRFQLMISMSYIYLLVL